MTINELIEAFRKSDSSDEPWKHPLFDWFFLYCLYSKEHHNLGEMVTNHPVACWKLFLAGAEAQSRKHPHVGWATSPVEDEERGKENAG